MAEIDKSLLDAQKAALELSKVLIELNKQEQSIKKEIENQITLKNELEKLTEQEIDQYDKQLKKKEAEAKQLEIILDSSKEILKNIENQVNKLKEREQLGEKLNLQEKEALKTLQEKTKEFESSRTASEIQLANLKNQIKQLEKISNYSKEIRESTRGILSIAGLDSQAFTNSFIGRMVKAKDAGLGFGQQLKVIGREIKDSLRPSNLFTQTMQSMTVATSRLIYEQQQALSSLNRATGAVGGYDDSIVELEKATFELGIDTGEATEAVASLRQSFTDFTILSRESQMRISRLSATMNELGIASELTAENIQIATTQLGLSAEQAVESQKEIFATAQQLEIAPREMAESFRRATPRLSAFGKEAVKQFKQLSVVSKATGLSVESLLDVTDQFDTFEGAGEAVGKLNAILGGPFLDSMELIKTTDPTERMKMIRNAVFDAGLSFESMSYYQRRAIASAAGLQDVSKLSQLLRGDIDEVASAAEADALSKEKMDEMAKQVQSSMDKLNQTLRAFAVSMLPVVNFVKAGIDKFLELNRTLGGYLVPILGTVAFSIGILPKLFMATTAAMTLFSGASTAASTAITATATVAKTSVGSMLAFGGAILLIGGGVALAAIGISKMIDSIKGLTGREMIYVTSVLLMIGAGIAGLAAVSTVATVPLLGLGAAVLLVGGGIALLGTGVQKITKSMSNMLPVISNVSLKGAASLGALAIGFTGLAASLALIKTDDLVAVGNIMQGISKVGNTTANSVSGIAKAIKEIANAVDEVPVKKTVSFVAATQALAVTATSAGNVETQAVENVKRIVDQAVRYRVVQEESRMNGLESLADFIFGTTKTTPATSANKTSSSSSRPIILELEGRTLKKFVIDVINDEMNPRKI